MGLFEQMDAVLTGGGGKQAAAPVSFSGTDEEAFDTLASELGVPPQWIKNVVSFESGGDPSARNPYSGARGVIQFMPSTARNIGYKNADDLVEKHPTIASQLMGPVRTYFKQFDPPKSERELYLQVFYPAGVDQSDDTVLPARVRKQNPGINTIGDYWRKLKSNAGEDSAPTPAVQGTDTMVRDQAPSNDIFAKMDAIVGDQEIKPPDVPFDPALAQQMDQVVDETVAAEPSMPRAPDWQRTAFPLSTAVAEGGKPSALRTVGANLAAGVDAISWPFRALDAAVNKGSEIVNPAVNQALGTNLVSWNEAKEGVANQIPGDNIVSQNLRTGVDMALSPSTYVGGGAIRKAITDIPKRMEQQLAKDLAIKLPKKTVEEMDQVVADGYTGPDRRVDTMKRKTIEEMSPEEMKKALAEDELTGLKSKRAFEDSEKKPVQALIDADGLKYVNDKIGYIAGDQLLKSISRALHDVGLKDDTYRIGGDEIRAQADNAKELAQKLEKAYTILDNATISATNADGSTVTMKGLGFSYGIGESSDFAAAAKSAEDRLHLHKAEREQLGLRAARGEEPPGVSRTPAARGADNGELPDGAIVSGIGADDISRIPNSRNTVGRSQAPTGRNAQDRYNSELPPDEEASLVDFYEQKIRDAQPDVVDEFLLDKSPDEIKNLLKHDSGIPLSTFPENVQAGIKKLRANDYEEFVRIGQFDEIRSLEEEIQRQQKLYDMVPFLRGKIDANSLNAAGDPNKMFENKRWIASSGGKDIDRVRIDFLANNRKALADAGISEESLADPTSFMDFLDGLPTRETLATLKRKLKAVDSEDYVMGKVGKYGVPEEAGKIPEPKGAGVLSVAEPRFSSETGDLFAGTDQAVKPDLTRAELKRREAAAPEQKPVTDLPLFDTQAQQGVQQGLKISEKEINPLTMGGITEGMAGRIKYAASTNLFREDVSNAVKKEWLDMTADYRSKFDEKNLRGTTNKMIQEIADGLGSKDIAKKLMKRTKDENFNVFELKASRDLIAQHMTEREKMTKDILSKGGIDALSAEDKVKYLSELEMQMMLAAQVNGLRSNAGHLLQSLRMMSKARKEYKSAQDLLDVWHGNQTGDEILRRFVELGSAPEAAKAQSKFLNRAIFAKASDKIYRYYIESILSAIPTDAANVIGNSATTGIRQTVGRAAGIAAENVSTGIKNIGLAAQGKELAKPTMHVGEISQAMAGMFKSFGPALKEAGRSLTTGESRFGRTPVEAEFVQPKGKTLSRAAAVLPTRRLQAADAFFKTINFSAEVHAQAYRKAMNEGLRGDALTKRVDEIVQSPELFNDVYEPAWADAQKQTFTDKPGEATRALSNFRRKWGLRWVVPFINTPIKILNYGMEWTPGASAWMLRNKLRRADLTREQKMDEIGKTVVSHLAAIPLVMAAKSGLITGAPPTDSAERKAKEKTGWRPYSIKVGDEYVQYQRIEPLATVLGVTSDFVNTLDDLDDTKMSDLAGRVVYAIQQNVLNKTFFTQLANFVEAATDKSGERLKRFVNTFAGAFVPNILNRGAAISDPYYRETDDIGDVLKSRIPGASQTLFPKRDVWGEPEEKNMSGWYGFFSPIAASKEKKNPVFDEVARLKMAIGKPSKKIAGVELTEAQYDEYQELAGKAAYEKVSRVVQGSRFKNADDEDKKENIRELISEAREVAREQMQRKYQLRDKNNAKRN